MHPCISSLLFWHVGYIPSTASPSCRTHKFIISQPACRCRCRCRCRCCAHVRSRSRCWVPRPKLPHHTYARMYVCTSYKLRQASQPPLRPPVHPCGSLTMPACVACVRVQEFLASTYNLALGICACDFLKMGSSLVAFMTSPLILSLPPMNSFCAFALPVTSLPKFSSDKERVTGKRKSVLLWSFSI